MLSMDYLEPTMISSISSDNFGIINGDVVGAKWRASLVLRGSVLIVAALATQLKTFQPAELVLLHCNLAAATLSPGTASSQAG